jgi:hypothetical protein
MGIFKKTIKYSKSSKDLDTKIKNLDEELKQTGVLEGESDSEVFVVQKENKLPKIHDNLEVEKKEEILYNWREEFITEEVDESQGIVEESEYKTVRKVESYISESNKELIEIRDQVFQEISESTLLNLPEIKTKIERVLEIYDQIQEGLLNEPPETKNEDPLTPLNQNFVTVDELNKHYGLFINRIQEQLATIGGGGETRLKYLDDIVGIATNASAYDGMFLSYDNTLGKFKFKTVSGGGGGSQTLNQTLGLGNTSSLGMSVGVVTATSINFASGGVLGDLYTDGGIGIGLKSPANYYAVVASNNLQQFLQVDDNQIFIGTGYASTTGTYDWKFDKNGALTFPDSTLQSTAFTGYATYASTAGVSTYATRAGIATYAQTAGIATSAGTATTATNLADAANITTGTINKDRISTTNALTVLGDLYVSNNISFGGTTTQLNTQQLEIVDADIVLGIGTSFSPTDNTANHGGIAIASTEGSPLVNLNIVPGEINPSTYKKIMWFKGDTIGAGLTDAWLFNYGVGIGSTNVPNGVYLSVGSVQFTERDLKRVGNINSSGIVTATSFVGSVTGTATTATTVDVLNTNGLTTIYYPTFVESRTDGQIVRADVDLSYRTDTNTLTVPNIIGSLIGDSTGLSGTPNITVGIVTSDISIPTQLRTRSVAERTTIISGNTVGLAFTTGSGNVAICTNPTGDITLNVTNIPTDSSFDNHSISFSVFVTQTGTARTCTAVNLNGVSRTIHWAGKSLANAISGITTTNGYDIFTFTGINTVGSANTTANYVVLGSVNGGFAI